MDLLPSPEQHEIVASVAGFLAAELPVARVRQLANEPSLVDRAVWAKCASLGWFGLGLGGELGGVGYGLAEEALLFREIGRHLAPGPFLPTVLGARIAALGGSADLCGAILSGETLVGLAELSDGGAVGDEVTGDLDLYDSVDADLAVVATPSGAALIETAALRGLEPVECLDPATRLASARADGVAALGFVERETDRTFLRGAVLASAMLAGIAEATRDMATEHAKTRIQFGKPIGVHQAVKHACTDMAVRAEAAACQTFLAAMTVDHSRADAAYQATSAKVVAGDAGLRNSRANIQLHGGMGFTWEHEAHLLLKRAHVLGRIFGDKRHHLAELITMPAAQ